MNLNITQILRPIRLAFLIQPNKRHSYLRAVRVSSSLWSGSYFPIFPIYKKFTHNFRIEYQLQEKPIDFYSKSIENFDPDYVVVDENIDTDFIEKIKGDRVSISLNELEESVCYKFGHLLINFRQRLRSELPQVQKDYNALYFDGVDKYYGVLSLSERWNSILMWSHYADFHKGYCVGFWEEKLRNTFIVTGGRVMYPPENNFPRLSPIGDFLETMIQESHVKSKDWKYEQEYRLAKVFYPVVPTTKDRIQEFPNDFISEIIIGINASEKTRAELIQIGKMKGVEVYQSIKKPFKFEMDRQRLF